MKRNVRLAKSLMSMILVVVMLASLCVTTFAASDIYFARYTGSSGSIVTALNAIGVDSSIQGCTEIGGAPIMLVQGHTITVTSS